MSVKIDRRQARTKQLLHTALMQLIQEKGIENITVTDIANRAEINRGTFYLHYKDVPDMLETMKDEVFNDLQSFIVKLDLREARKYANAGEPYPAAVQILEEIARHANFLRVMLGSQGDLSYAHRLKDFMSVNIFNKLNYLQPDDDNLLIPKDYLIAYMSSAQLGLVMHWLETGMEKTPYQMGMIMTQINNHGPIVSSLMKE